MDKFKGITSSKKFRILLFGITFVLFLLYIIFFSNNNLRKRRELNKKISNLEKSIIETKNTTRNNYSFEQLKEDSSKLEHYGRESLNMQKANEDVFIIVYE